MYACSWILCQHLLFKTLDGHPLLKGKFSMINKYAWSSIESSKFPAWKSSLASKKEMHAAFLPFQSPFPSNPYTTPPHLKNIYHL